ncbi:mitochondrial import receptor subunit TOM70 [Anastrepha ludens]|uniref:mitochondrial import receptor subunit TOM70 n=1 Tax=Anastrepha ludens TaxID=28586 RepID=UPI0023AFF5B7|nr:mitochondrial import receptor subunit TOM70 [Anastrepha ludens]XP_053960137.1 mitochondrial import receptor subunit TOM70 [Anastrepha ludens]XP_053960138.1 mitochondrial import receptor subunit TOM70 [Anastrepha ludens]
MAYRYGSVNITRWQLALLIGTPVAIGLGVYIYRNSIKDKKSISDNDTSKSADERKKGLPTKNKNQTISIDGTGEDKELERKKKSAELGSEKLSPLKEATMYKNEGNVCYRNGKYDEAISFYDKAIDKCPPENRTDLAIFYQNRAASYEMLKKWNRVKEDCSHSLEYNPRYAKAYYRRAKAHEATNDLMECLDDVTATCILEMFQNNSTIMYADRILKQTGRDDTARGIKEHEPVLPSKNFIHTFLRSFIADPIDAVTVPAAKEEGGLKGFARAKKALEEAQYGDVMSACTEEIETSESESQYKTEALLLRGTFHLLSGNFSAAQQDLDAVINNADADVSLHVAALIKRASLHIQQEEKDLGLADFKTASKLQPENPDVYHQRAQFYILIDQLPEALSEFEKVVKMAPSHAMAYIQKCYAEYRMALMAQDQIRLMIVMNEFKNAIEKFPDCVECYSLMAQVLCDQQQFQQADQFYEKALKLAPENASLYVHRGILLLQWKGDVDKAVELMLQAMEVDNKCLLAYETLGTIEVQRANLNRAVELFEKAIKFSKSRSEMSHLYALRNAAVAQVNVTRKLGIDMSTISALAQSGAMPTAL